MGELDAKVASAVAAWLRWVPSWAPTAHRVRARICHRCMGSPLLIAAGISDGTPHQVKHALVARMQRIVDRAVDEYTTAHLPALEAELRGAELWGSGGYNPRQGLAPEWDGMELDPEPADEGQPFLFTIADLAAQSQPAEPLPRPPLNAEEKRQLRKEMELADACAQTSGQEVCFALLAYRSEIIAALERYVEPQIDAIISELSQHLEPPR